jgi:hypothetical protein
VIELTRALATGLGILAALGRPPLLAVDPDRPLIDLEQPA